jgi:hypothetical protein
MRGSVAIFSAFGGDNLPRHSENIAAVRAASLTSHPNTP